MQKNNGIHSKFFMLSSEKEKRNASFEFLFFLEKGVCVLPRKEICHTNLIFHFLMDYELS